MRWSRSLAAGLVLAGLGCSKTQAPGAPATPGAPGATDATAEVATPTLEEDADAPADPRETAQWALARDGDAEELMRLADLVGCGGLHRGASRAADRTTALRAAQYCDDFSELPWLVEVATTGVDGDAHVALDAIIAEAARRRRPVDPDDAEELHSGCLSLLTLAKASDRPRDRRAPAVSALRMLVDYGCVKNADIPTDVDAK